MEEIKRQNMERFILETRTELIQWWDKCYYSVEQRKQFEPQYSTDYSEELLALHEAEIEKMKGVFKSCEAMFALVEERQKLWLPAMKLDEASKNAGRYKRRSFNPLREEKERKQVNKNLPVIEEKIRSAAEEYERVHGEPFLIAGIPYKDYMDQQVTARRLSC